MGKIRWVCIILFSFFEIERAHAEYYITLDKSKNEYLIESQFVCQLEDPNANLTIDKISSISCKNLFKPSGENMLRNKNRDAAYWYRFKIINKTHSGQQWLLESFNFRINEISLFMDTDSGMAEVKEGDIYPFRKRDLNHKNFEFLLPYSSDTLTYYLRIKTKQHASFEIYIRRFDIFTSYAIGEYFLLGIFYGTISIVALFSLLMLVSFRKIVFLYYSLFLTGFGIFFMCQDGTGFQYLWPDFPILNTNSILISRLLTLIPYTFYFCEFLEVRKKLPWVWKGMMVWMIIRLLSIFIEDDDNDLSFMIFMYYDYIPFVVAYFSAIYSYLKGFKPALYFTIGFSVLLCSFIINSLRVACIVESNIFTAYSLNFGAVIEILLLSLSLGSWLRIIIQEKTMTEKMNRLLEEKVEERTHVLQIQNGIINEKVNELDTLFYRLSHDIKGPLKSILGLTNLGIIDKKDSDRYFNLIQSSAKNLDKITSDFVQLSSVQNSDTNYVGVNFQELIDTILDSLSYMPDFEKINIQNEINSTEPFFTNRHILYSVILNIIENAIKYRNPNLNIAKLEIVIQANNEKAVLEFTDNGIGIEKDNELNIFNMFFREGKKEGVSGSGLGLYIVKISLQKINGTIAYYSHGKDGSTFIVEIPNMNKDQ